MEKLKNILAYTVLGICGLFILGFLITYWEATLITTGCILIVFILSWSIDRTFNI